jgi:hypothetical protein
MIKASPVVVHWSADKRKNLPTSGQYTTVARFEEDRATWGSDAWSVVLNIHGDVSAEPCRADARFLMQNAPHDRLKPGTRFELLEGDKVTAQVEVVAT